MYGRRATLSGTDIARGTVVSSSAAFVGLYFWAASLYPGGTRLDRESEGYQHVQNFWCDLLDPVSYSGVTNPARPIAMGSVGVAVLAVGAFFYVMPAIDIANARSRMLVRITGVAGSAMGLLLPVEHDVSINLAALALAVALMATLHALIRERRVHAMGLMAVPLALCGANFAMWHMSFHLELMPLVQKAAMATCLAWMSTVAMRPSLYT